MNVDKLEGAETKVTFVKGYFWVQTKFEPQLSQRGLSFVFILLTF